MTFDTAQEAFDETPCRATANAYLLKAMEYRQDNMIGKKTFAHALSEILKYTHGLNQT